MLIMQHYRHLHLRYAIYWCAVANQTLNKGTHHIPNQKYNCRSLACRTKIQEQLAAGENVVLLANHQTEADPGVFAHMLAASHPSLATDVIYVAGDRVVTDALCKPFSMGRNLFCVHSKKHLDDVPELKASKMETNRKTLVAMQRAFNAGGTLVWIAPSGGRDR
jgi:glycerol-3-phosphate O-acyltransferase